MTDSQTTTTGMQHQAKPLAVMSHIIQAMSSNAPSIKVLQIAVDELHQGLQISHCLLFQPGTMAPMVMSKGTMTWSEFTSSLHLLHTHYQPVLANGKPVILPSVELPHVTEDAAHEVSHACSLLAVPLMYQGLYLGMMALCQDDRLRTWTPEDIEIGQTVATLCAITLKQAELAQQLYLEQAKRQELETILRQHAPPVAMSEYGQTFQQAQMEATHRALLEAIPDLIIRMARDGTYLDFLPSENIKIIKPYSEMSGKNLYDVMPSKIAQERMHYVDRALQTGEPQSYEFELEIDGKLCVEEARIVVSGANEVLVIIRDITDRKQTEAILARREHYLTALVQIQLQLLVFKGSGHYYNNILKTLGSVSGASRIYVFENYRDQSDRLLMNQRAEWCAEGIQPEIDNPILQNLSYDDFFPRWAEWLAQGKPIVGVVADFPEPERIVLEPQGILSILVLPLIVNREFFGFIGFDHCLEAHVWETSEIALLQAAASAISIAQERSSAEAALQQSQQFLQLVIDNIPQMIFWKDSNSVYQGCNHNFARVAGLEVPEQIVGKTDYDLPWKPEESDWFRACDRRVMDSNIPEYHIIEPQLQADGKQSWADTNKMPLHNADGEVIGILGTYEDITERIQAEESLRQSEERLRSLVEQTNDWVWEIDRNTVFTYVNPQVQEIIGYEINEVIGKTVFDLMSSGNVKRFAALVRLYMSQRKSFTNVEKAIVHKTGHWIVLETSGCPVFDAQGSLQGYRCISRDITERKRAEQEIRKALMREKELRELKSRFVSITSHEFRTPLSVISSSAGVLEDYGPRLDESKRSKHLQRIQSSVRHMTQLLEDVLVINRAEVGKLEFHPTFVDVIQFCSELIEEFQSGITSDHRIVLKRPICNSPLSFSTWANAYIDTKLLRQILDNLLSNAVKYSPNHSTVYLELALDDEMAVFCVKDKGIGIPDRDQERLFESFHRATNVGNIPGTGLGLTIVKNCIEVHGGAIAFTSKVGVGTTFIVKLPLNPPNGSLPNAHLLTS